MFSKCLLLLIVGFTLTTCANLRRQDGDDSSMHKHDRNTAKNVLVDPKEKESSYWQDKGRERLKKNVEAYPDHSTAKNVIFFLGDGMSLPTLAAARAYMGQMEGKPGEEQELSFEKFPVTGLSKTYCVDKQVADSACSATAYLGGVKGNDATIGVNANVELRNCEQMMNVSNHVDSIAKKFLDEGRSAGLVTTTRVTHASPAGVYAHIADRDWENDKKVKEDKVDPTKCRDIAHQLIYNEIGQKLKVILGGGRREFLPNTTKDEEGFPGERTDNRSLIDEWKALKANESFEYVWNRNQLMNVDNGTDYLLGLFESSHCEYNLLRNKTTEPSLEDMVTVAINKLSQNDNGYFLFVEGGRIDQAHHDNWAHLALDETVEFSKAIEKALTMTDPRNTLIVVTSDHSHSFTYNGYPNRGNNILGVVGELADDGKNYTTLSYANGLGYKKEVDEERVDPTDDPDYGDVEYRFPAMVPLTWETHGGDDVAVFATGPWQHIFTGLYEQSTIPYLIEYAACLDEEHTVCAGSMIIYSSLILVFLSSIIRYLIDW